MNRSSRSDFRASSRRRGVTLVEMLVTVAVLVIIMTILVQVFQAATGAVSAAQALQQIDDQFRRLDGTIRTDLAGVTAHFTPPLDPVQNLGYFEYGENEFADIQGEDSDDYLRFTAKAPPGQPFTGRMWVTNPAALTGFYNGTVQPVTITSEYAEIIYFLRNGNLYRRVLLVAPELQSAIVPTLNNQGYLLNAAGNPATTTYFAPGALGGNNLSWLAVNDLSARPAGTGPNTAAGLTAGQQAQQTIVLNTLADLTNRENRFAYSRFANDFLTVNPGAPTAPTNGADGRVDDVNYDNVPDLYTSLYPNLFNLTNQLVFAPPFTPNSTTGNGILQSNPGNPFLAFPYVFPGAYSKAQYLNSDTAGWIHSPQPQVVVNNTPYQFDKNPLIYLQNINHNPLDTGDNVNTPSSNSVDLQTWWGFPTWRETLSTFWNDPTIQVNVALTQPDLLTPLTGGEVSLFTVGTSRQLLPPMFAPWRIAPQLYADKFGDQANLFSSATTGLWALGWEDDLIMTGVRSFDVKAYDGLYSGYVDLGWGDDARITGSTNYLYQTLSPSLWNAQYVPTFTGTFAHEGRVPPLIEDNVSDAQFGAVTAGTYSNFTNYTGNVGDDTSGVVRLRRVWDSWSTNYSRAPGTGVYYNINAPPSSANPDPENNFPVGPPFTPPIYPSYQAPYPAPLRAIQIQIRAVDPTNQRIKSLTIIQDFTDKL